MPDQITFKRLSSGYVLIRGSRQAQVPHWPCSEEILREHTFQLGYGPDAEAFIAKVMALTPTEGSE